MMCAQMKAFFDATGGHWQKGSLVSGSSSSSSVKSLQEHHFAAAARPSRQGCQHVHKTVLLHMLLMYVLLRGPGSRHFARGAK